MVFLADTLLFWLASSLIRGPLSIYQCGGCFHSGYWLLFFFAFANMSVNPIAYVKVLIVICVLIRGDNFLLGLGKIYFIGCGIFSLLSGGLIA